MKKTFLSLLCLAMSMTAGAQQYMRIWQGGNDTRVALQDITYSADGTTLQVAGQQYNTASVDSITMVHVITVTYQGGQATVDAGKAPGVTYTVEGANVNIVSTNKTQELETVLQGTSTNGSLTYTGPLKCKFYLNGLNLTSTQGAAIDIQCGKRVDLILVDGTQNTVTDAAGGLQKAALYCKGHLEVEHTSRHCFERIPATQEVHGNHHHSQGGWRCHTRGTVPTHERRHHQHRREHCRRRYTGGDHAA